MDTQQKSELTKKLTKLSLNSETIRMLKSGETTQAVEPTSPPGCFNSNSRRCA